MEIIKHLNVYQLSKRWGVSCQTLQNWRSQGRGPAYIKLGGRVLYRLLDVESFEAERTHTQTGQAA
ncbi:helix-turn-helix transcriptional regulator [Magnetofaba australis]|uniref:Helix-turn-helix domain-containing protein n=1 Tax=Magnetofaba australis IT-1 TaxID=1434232 RepID=A0A1Y2K9X2_9PROT|nr:helix-turn-helix domain-containing protein [Magnetofaba australis]OSM07630.1 hypothetical protein MAIT1_04391 [Magnetofaba australis IT-1]